MTDTNDSYIVQKLYNYNTTKILERFFGDFKFFDNTNVPRCSFWK